jgi:glycosyltransferase involved in cell wall biosynthesis
MVKNLGDFPPEIRLEKEVRTLQKAGHKITIVCSMKKKITAYDTWEGCDVIRLSEKTSRFGKLLKFITFNWTFYDKFWDKNLDQIIKTYEIDVLHVHDLPMLKTSLIAAKRNKIPVVIDFHENYPGALPYYIDDGTFLSKILLNMISIKRWERYEITDSAAANHILVVVDEAKERLISQGIDEKKITVLENTEDVENFCSMKIDPEIKTSYEKDFILIYVGGFGGDHRGLLTVIEAIPIIAIEIPNIRLVLVGDGPIKPRLIKLTKQLGLETKVTFIDWQPFIKVSSWIDRGDICIIPHNSNPQTEATSPHKLFQYMLMKKPIIVSSCRPLKRVIEECQAGLVFQAGDRVDFAKKVIDLKDEKVRLKYGENGHLYATNKYNWELLSYKLLTVYDRLEKSN